MFTQPIISLLSLLALATLLFSCGDEKNVDPTEDNERITTISLQFINKADPKDAVVLTLDNIGADGTQPTSSSTSGSLKPYAAYSMAVVLGDRSKNPAEDVTAKIKAEANEHLFVYTPSSGLNLGITLSDLDTNPAPGPYPVGLTANASTGPPSTGKLNVVLRHQPGTKNGKATPGTSDLDVNFDVVVR
ncbi:MAG: hypothetical protein EAZ91_25180 [Cytophagales bacterium]|nr:MAG: hypothetical protein EAZ91_25180 [Cytophagales bacterium]